MGGYCFSIDLPEEYIALLTNYAPFAAAAADDELFHLHVAAEHRSPVVEHVFVDASDDDMPRLEVSRTAEGWLIEESMTRESPICLHLYATADFREAWLMMDTDNVRFAIDNAAILLYAFATASKGCLEMHASVTVKDGYGYLFLGKSGTGKSTHSRLWQEAFPEAWLLNDDNPVIRLEADGTPYIYGTPWSGKTPCYKNERVPLGGIVRLQQAPYNKITRLKGLEAFTAFLPSCSSLKWKRSLEDVLCQTVETVVSKVGVWHLECLPDEAAARLSNSTITQ